MTYPTKDTFARNQMKFAPMPKDNRMLSLEWNIRNMRLSQHPKGSAAWIKSATSSVLALGHPELEGIPIVRGKPAFLANAGNLIRKEWNKSERINFKRINHGYGTRFSKRVVRAMRCLEDCPIENVGFITPVVAYVTTKEEALALARSAGAKLSRFIRNRFPHAIWLLFPEVDEVTVGSVADNILVDRGWKQGLSDKTLVYKVHFHGAIYVPGSDVSAIEAGFCFYRSGKRVRHYCGVNQVRVLPIRPDPDQTDPRPDIVGVSGYSTKKHCRPACDARMLEGYAEWMWLTHQIASDESLVQIGGVTSGIYEYCSACDHYYPRGDDCRCESVVRPDDSIGFDIVLNSFKGSSPDSIIDISDQAGLLSSLNSVGSSIWNSYQKMPTVEKVTTAVFGGFSSLLKWMKGHIRGP